MGYPQNSVIGGGAADGQRLLVCAAVDKSDGSVHPGYIQDDNCIYGRDGAQAVAENYLVLATNDPEVTRTEEAQPALQGFDPGSILGGKGGRGLLRAQGGCLRGNAAGEFLNRGVRSRPSAGDMDGGAVGPPFFIPRPLFSTSLRAGK
jgi:hypothetical protein